MPNEIVTVDGEIVPSSTQEIDISASVSLMKAEIDMAIATSRAYPRSVTKAIARIKELATLDDETAEMCCYALIRKKKGQRDDDDENKPIEGPSIRLAEIAVTAWGNARVDARVISVNRQEKYVEARGVFHDLETNVATASVVRRRISTKKGYLFSDDMISVTANAACSIAKRNSILSGIPRGVYGPGYKAARMIMAGTIETLGENRAKVYKAFNAHGVTPAQIHEHLGVGGEADIGLEHIAQLRAAFSAIKNGEATVEEMFGKQTAGVGAGVVDPLNDDAGATTVAVPIPEPKEKKKTKPDPIAVAVKAAKEMNDMHNAANQQALERIQAEQEAGPTLEDLDAKFAQRARGHSAAAAEVSGRPWVPGSTPEEPKGAPFADETPKAAPEPEAKQTGTPTSSEQQFADEPSYTAHVAEFLAAVTTATAAKEAYNATAERAFRRQPWVTITNAAKWGDMLRERVAELAPKEGA